MLARVIRLTINGFPERFPRVLTASAALAWLGYGDPREFALRRRDGTLVGSARRLGDVLRDGEQLELVRL